MIKVVMKIKTLKDFSTKIRRKFNMARERRLLIRLRTNLIRKVEIKHRVLLREKEIEREKEKEAEASNPKIFRKRDQVRWLEAVTKRETRNEQKTD